MLIKGLGNIEEAVDLNLKLQDRLSLFTYPFRTKKEIETEINHIQNKDEKYENDCLLSFYDNDKFLGWVILFINQIEKYGKIDYLTLKEYNEKCIDDLIDYIEKSYAGYTFDFGIPMENKVMNEKMQKKGFKMIESYFDNRITLGKERYYRNNIELLKLENFDKYSTHYN